MTEARRLLPNQAHAISRRTSQRRFFLVPTDFCKRVVAYAFAVANEDYPTVQIHVLVAMSNHIEIVASDAHGPDEDSQLPRFFRDAHALIASAMNHHYGRGEHFWAPGSYRNTEIHDLPALADRLATPSPTRRPPTWSRPSPTGRACTSAPSSGPRAPTAPS